MSPPLLSRRKPQRKDRRGAITVEFALVAIPFFAFVFGTIEFGRALMGVQSLEEASRAGCRVAVLKGATTQDVNDEVDHVMAMAGITNYNVSVVPGINGVPRWEPVSVRVTASFGDMSWLPGLNYFDSLSYTASSTLPREAGS